MEAKRILHLNLAPQVARELIEKKHNGLPPLWLALRLGVVLIGADQEAIGEVLVELQPLRLDLAVGQLRILTGIQRIDLDLLIEVRMRLKQPAGQSRRAKPGAVIII